MQWSFEVGWDARQVIEAACVLEDKRSREDAVSCPSKTTTKLWLDVSKIAFPKGKILQLCGYIYCIAHYFIHCAYPPN